MTTLHWITLAAMALILIVGAVAEKHVVDVEWGKKRRFRQQVQICYQRQIIRHRTPYAEIGWRR